MATASLLLLAACGNATDMPVAAPGEDIVASDSEGMADAPVILASDLSRDMFSEDPDVFDNLAYGVDSDAAESAFYNWFDTSGTNVRIIDAADGRRIFLGTARGIKNSDATAMQVYAEFLPTSPFSNSLEYLGTRRICARGANTTDWTTDPCP